MDLIRILRLFLFFTLICNNLFSQNENPAPVNKVPVQILIEDVDPSVPVFIGLTEKAINLSEGDLLFVPKKVNSLIEYHKYYGSAPQVKFSKISLDTSNKVIATDVLPPPSFLYHSMVLYFQNGGPPCYITSIGDYQTQCTKEIFIRGLDSVGLNNDITLLVFPDAIKLPETDLFRLQQESLERASNSRDRFCILDLGYFDTKASLDEKVSSFRTNTSAKNLMFGAVYAPFFFVNAETKVLYNNWKDVLWKNGEKVQLQNLVNVSGRPQVTRLTEAINQIKDDFDASQVNTILKEFPEISKIPGQLSMVRLALPPSSSVAAKYCEVDKTRGVWKAPANISISGINHLSFEISTKDQETLNVDPQTGKSINVIRHFHGKGNLIWGARTLAGNDNEWRYISVRRFFNLVEESIINGCKSLAFEPNDISTWTSVKLAVEKYLIAKWRAGALSGSKPEQAFFVNVGIGQSMTVTDVQEKRLVIEIGMAVTRPAEFNIMRITLKMH